MDKTYISNFETRQKVFYYTESFCKEELHNNLLPFTPFFKRYGKYAMQINGKLYYRVHDLKMHLLKWKLKRALL